MAEKDARINVVFEYTKDLFIGGRFFSSFLREEIGEIQAKNEKPDSETKIIAIGVSDDEAQRLCFEAM